MPPTRREILKLTVTCSSVAALAACGGGQSSPSTGRATASDSNSAQGPVSDSGSGGGSGSNPDGGGGDSQDPVLDTRSFDYPMVLPVPFAHGVASGDPMLEPESSSNNSERQARVILWTRITQREYNFSELPVRWVIGSAFEDSGDSPAVTNIINSGTQSTNAARDWTVKIDADGLQPGTTYYYQFFTLGEASIVGRTRTPPAEVTDEVRFAVASCSSYWSSTWSGYGHIADRNDLDLMVHLGDYIYDFVDNDEEVRARVDAEGNVFNNITDVDYRDWLNIDECRRRYALYRSDPNLTRAHQQHPWTIVWDNHDIDPGFGNELDDSAVDRSGENTTLDETCQVFWEWTPSRPPKDNTGAPLLVTGSDYPAPPDVRQVWRKIDFGPMVDILCSDIEIYRQQINEGESLPDDYSDHLVSGNSLLGKQQYEYLTSSMLASKNAGKTWRFVPHQTWIAPWNVPAVAAGLEFDGTPIQTRWNDFGEEREQLFEFMRSNSINNNIIASGDMHGNWASDMVAGNSLTTSYQSGASIANPRSGSTAANATAGFNRATTNNTIALNNRAESVGVDFAPTSLGRGGADELVANASPNNPESANVQAARAIEKASIDGNKNVQFMEWVDHGYGIVHMTSEQAIFEFWWQDKLTENSPDVLGNQMVSFVADNSTALPSPRYVNQIDVVTLHGMTVEETSGSRIAEAAPEAELDPR